MFLLVFRFWTATFFTFFVTNGFKLQKEKALEMLPTQYGRNELQSSNFTLQTILALFFKLLRIALSVLAVIYIFAIFILSC